MKNIQVLFTGLLLLITMTSCPEQSSSIRITRIIKNSTDYPVDITIFIGENQSSFNIPPRAVDSVEEFCYFKRGNLQSCDIVLLLDNADSVQLNFDGDNKLVYRKNEHGYELINNKNIMSFDPFIETAQSNFGYEEISENIFVFQIEESDYALATPF